MEPITLVTVAVAIVATMATGYAYFRSSAVKVWEQNSAAYQARVELLEDQNTRLEEQVQKLMARVVELESRPDWDKVIHVVDHAEKNILAAMRAIADETILAALARLEAK